MDRHAVSVGWPATKGAGCGGWSVCLVLLYIGVSIMLYASLATQHRVLALLYSLKAELAAAGYNADAVTWGNWYEDDYYAV